MLSISAMRAAAGGAAAVLRALSNEDRLLLLCQMSQGEYSVGELEELAGYSAADAFSTADRAPGGRFGRYAAGGQTNFLQSVRSKGIDDFDHVISTVLS
jgi:hypothetical protein